MRIWTTPQLNSLLAIPELPVRLVNAADLKKTYLTQSESGDIAILDFDDDYLYFLATAREMGVGGAILFITPEPTMAEPDLSRYNALLLDLKKMGRATVKSFVALLLGVAVRQGALPNPPVPPEGLLDPKKEQMTVDGNEVVEKMQTLCKRELPLVVSFDVLEQGVPVTARSLCNIKEVHTDRIVFHRIRQAALMRGVKKDLPVKIDFSYKDRHYGGVVTIQQKTENELIVSVPAQLFLTRGLRIQPNPAKPVNLYLHIPSEPTSPYKVLNISPHGVGFLCARDLPLNSIYSFTFILPDPTVVVVTSGAIRYKKNTDDSVLYGAEIRPHPWDEENIAKYVMKREAEIISLVRTSG